MELVSGFGIVPITPTSGASLSGFGVRTAASEGIHDPLYARALTLGDGPDALVLIVMDVIGVDSETTARIRGRLAAAAGLQPERVAVAATHTHGGPGMLTGARLGDVDRLYLDRVVEGAVAAAQAALADRAPSHLRAGTGRETTVAHNRRVPDGPIDDSVGILRVERPDGSVRGLMVSYACHPVTVGPDNLLFTRDYPGVVVDTLEALYPGATVMFATGCCGQINTGHSAQDSIRGVGLELRTFREAHRLGRLLAATALHESERLADPRRDLQNPPATRTEPAAGLEDTAGHRGSAAATTVSHRPHLASARRPIDLPLAPVRAPDALEREQKRSELERLVAGGRPPSERLLLEAWLAWSESTDWSARSVPAEVQCFRVGDICIALFPGEAFVEFGLELRAARPDLNILPVAYANAAPGYLPHHSAFAAGGYEVDEAYLYYGQAAPFASDVGRVLVATMLEAIAATDPEPNLTHGEQ